MAAQGNPAGRDKRERTLEPGFVPPDRLAEQRLRATLGTDDFCMDMQCGHRRGMHKGLTGYCHAPGCGCMGHITNDAASSYFRRD